MSQFIFQRRDFSDIILPSLKYTVKNYKRAALGGPKTAQVEAVGSRVALFELVEHLRAPVEIFNENHEAKWWGYIDEVRITTGGIEYGVSLGTMANSVAVAYTVENERKTTDYSTDTISSTEYGTKDDLLSRSNITDADAMQLRDTTLAARKYPVPNIRVIGQSRSEDKAVIYCRGWLDTLDWRHYTNNEGLEAYETPGTVDPGREIGEDDRPIFAQAFQLSSDSGWTASTIWIRLWKKGSPVDNMQVALKSNSGGNPGTTLASATVAGANVETSATWTEFTLSSTVALSTGTTYWIHCSRSGSISTSDYYVVGVNKDLGYLNGDAKMYNTNLSAWVDASHKGDLNFRVMGDTATDEQITDLITNVGEFFTGTQIIDTSGVETNAYRNGDNTALYELLKLLATGSTNDRRMLCEVLRPRILKVYEEPAKPSVSTEAYALTSSGVLETKYGREAPPSDCVVGVWCNLGDVVPGGVDLSRISDPSVFFIEEAEYSPERDEYRVLRTRDQTDVFEIGGVR